MAAGQAPGDAKARGAVRPTLFIGLGGTGKEILLRVRRRFFERYGRASLPYTRFLWIDASQNAEKEGARDFLDRAVEFENDEKIKLLERTVGTDMLAVFENPKTWRRVHEWLHPEVASSGRQITDGAGNVRSVGRLCLHFRFNSVQNAILEAFADLTTPDVKRETGDFFPTAPDFAGEPQIFLVQSVVGGTGSGTIADVAFLLRHLSHPDTPGQRMIERTVGITLLPNVYYPTQADDKARRSYANAYAALKELEHFTINRNVGASGFLPPPLAVEWEEGYPRRIVGPPFLINYLFEMRTQEGIALRRKEEVFQLIAENLMLDVLPGEFSSKKRERYSNVITDLNKSAQQEVAGRTQIFSKRYGSFGLAKIEIPKESLQGACASQLCCDVLRYWARPLTDPAIAQNTQTDLRNKRLDADGMIGRFGFDWRTRLDQAFKPAAAREIASIEHIDALEQELDETKRRFVNDVGTVPEHWGSEISNLHLGVAQVRKDLAADIDEWIENCVTKPERGLRATLAPAGYLDRGEQLILEQVGPRDGAQRPVYDRRADVLRQTVAEKRQRQKRGLAQLRYSLTSTARKAIDRSDWTIRHVRESVVQAAREEAGCTCELFVIQRCRALATEALGQMKAKKALLQPLLDLLEPTARAFEEQSADQRAFGQDILFTRLFDAERDWPEFYSVAGNPVNSTHLEAFQEKLLNALQTGPDPLINRKRAGQPTLLDLARLGDRFGQDVPERMAVEASKVFLNDFKAHPRDLDVLSHPAMKREMDRKVRDLVANALPRVKLDSRLGATDITAPKEVYVGLGRDPETNSDYRTFYASVKREFSALGFNNINHYMTDRPWEVCVYTDTVAFPLPAVPLVAADCHNAYYAFYRAMTALDIPSHLSRRWEGTLEDLRVISDAEAVEAEECLRALFLGTVLKVVQVKLDTEGVHEFAYTINAVGHSKRQTLGRRRSALEALRRDSGVRLAISEEIQRRETALKADNLEGYFWALLSLEKSSQLSLPRADKALLEQERARLLPRLNDPNVKITDSENPTTKAAAGGYKVDAGLDFSTSSELEPWVKER